MVKPELTQYIKNEQASGKNFVEIKQALLSVGWQEAQINEAMGQAAESVAPVSPIILPMSAANSTASTSSTINPTIADVSKVIPTISMAQKPKKSIFTLILIILLVVLLLGAGGV